MIQELKIKNFLSFKEEVIFSFEATNDKTLEDYYVKEVAPGVKLLKMAMVYGANASGKSNLINAFDFIKDIIFNITESKEEGIDFHPFAFDKTVNEPGEFELIFYIENIKHIYTLIVDNEAIHKEKLVYYPGTQPAIIFDRVLNKNTSVIEFGNKIEISKVAKEEISLKTLKNSSVFAAYSQVNISIPEIESVYDWFREKLFQSINPYTSLTEYSDKQIQDDVNIKEEALKFIQRADFNISDISFKEEVEPIDDVILDLVKESTIPTKEKNTIIKEKAFHVEKTIFEHHVIKDGKDEYYPLPKERQSKGTMRYYGLSAPFFNTINENAFLAIDEIGSALHPLLVLHFITEFLKKSDSAQLLFTTHNMSLLNEKDILRRDAIWFTNKNDDGSTELSSVSDYTDFRKELSYYNYYKQGKFGAIPRLD